MGGGAGESGHVHEVGEVLRPHLDRIQDEGRFHERADRVSVVHEVILRSHYVGRK